mgnify:CR=1 FL=1
MNTSEKTILCLDRDEQNLELLTLFFRREGFEVETHTSFRAYSKNIGRKDYAAVILEYFYEELAVDEICFEFRATLPNVPIIFCSVESRRNKVAKAINAGGTMYFAKPLDFEKIVSAVKELSGIKNKTEQAAAEMLRRSITANALTPKQTTMRTVKDSF